MPSFRDLRIWKEAYRLMLEIDEICETLPREERFRLKDQIERSSSSVPDNIAEAYAAYYYNDKIKGMYVARKEAAETQNHIKKLEGKKYLHTEKSESLIQDYEGLIKGINSYINYIREKRDKGDRKGRGKGYS